MFVRTRWFLLRCFFDLPLPLPLSQPICYITYFSTPCSLWWSLFCGRNDLSKQQPWEKFYCNKAASVLNERQASKRKKERVTEWAEIEFSTKFAHLLNVQSLNMDLTNDECAMLRILEQIRFTFLFFSCCDLLLPRANIIYKINVRIHAYSINCAEKMWRLAEFRYRAHTIQHSCSCNEYLQWFKPIKCELFTNHPVFALFSHFSASMDFNVSLYGFRRLFRYGSFLNGVSLFNSFVRSFVAILYSRMRNIKIEMQGKKSGKKAKEYHSTQPLQ